MSIKNLKANPDFWILLCLFCMSLIGVIVFSIKGWLILQVISICLLVMSVFVLFLNQEIYKSITTLLFGPSKTNLKAVGSNRQKAFIRVQNTINNRKVFVSSEEDGIYIRLAGNENEGEAFSEVKVKVYDYER